MSVMSRAWGSPSRYIQGAGEIKRLPEQTEWVKEKASIDPASIIGYVKMADAIGEEYKRKRCAIS